MVNKQRPLSPHLQIYKPQLTSVLSILHRMTGICLSVALFGFVYWLYLLSSHEKCFVCTLQFFQTIWGKGLFAAGLFSFFYHLFNGLRHLMWDAGKGLTLTSVYQSGYLVLCLTLASTILTLCSLWFA